MLLALFTSWAFAGLWLGLWDCLCRVYVCLAAFAWMPRLVSACGGFCFLILACLVFAAFVQGLGAFSVDLDGSLVAFLSCVDSCF